MIRCACIKCDKLLKNYQAGENRFQPDNGVAFLSYGHYGSTYFDPMDGSFLEIAICDECLKEAVEKNIVQAGKGYSL